MLDGWTKRFGTCLVGIVLGVSTAAAQYGVTAKPMSSRRPPTPNIGVPGTRTSRSWGPGGIGSILGGGGPLFGLPTSQRRLANRSPVAPRLRDGSGLYGYAPLTQRQRLLSEHSLAGTIRSLNAGIEAFSLVHAPRQVDLDRAIQEVGAATEGDRAAFADLMVERLAAYQREQMADGWAYFKNGDYLRSLGAFEAAESLDRRKWGPRFGQLMSAAASGHYRRAINKLKRIVDYDAARPPGEPGMFEYDTSLQSVVATEQALDVLLRRLRHLAQNHPESIGSQALYCYLLWYGRLEDAAIEAAAIAERINRTYPESFWSRFGPMIQEAQRKAAIARERDDPSPE